jgi:hypothetical protein
MPLFTGLLFFFIALALLPLALRNSGARELRRQRARDVEQMTIGARICEIVARDAFGIELDHSMESITALDALITNGWADTAAGTNTWSNEEHDPTFVLGSYLGDIFIRHEHSEWQWEHDEAFLYFSNGKRTVSPFDLIQRKLREPLEVHLKEETTKWLIPLIPQHDDGNTKS